MTREAAFLLKQIQLVRTGMFTAVAQDGKTLAQLKDLSRRKDQYGYQSAALIAEIKDQVGEYQQASDFANYVVGTSQLTLLADAIRLRRPHEVVRAHAWLLLQCAVSEFRRVGGHQNGIDLLTGGINRISANRGEAINSQHIESLFYFWRCRILSIACFSFLEENEDFNTAIPLPDTKLS